MYRILGADRKEYGPVPEEVVRRWISERRMDARSSIRRDGETGWKTLSDFPEFRSLVAGGSGSATSPPLPPSARPAATPAPSPAPTLGGRRRTNGLAIATLIVGILAPCTAGIAGIVGVVLGIVALTQISRSRGAVGGKGLAVTGLVLSAFFLVVGPLVLISGIMAKNRVRYQNFDTGGECNRRVQQLSQAVRMFANDNNDRLPPAATWCDAVQSDVSGLNAFQCPARPGLRCGFAFNAALSGKSDLEVARDTVLLFESDLGWNGSGDAGAMIPAPRHNGFFTVVLADGSIRQIGQSGLSTLRWNP